MAASTPERRLCCLRVMVLQTPHLAALWLATHMVSVVAALTLL